MDQNSHRCDKNAANTPPTRTRASFVVPEDSMG